MKYELYIAYRVKLYVTGEFVGCVLTYKYKYWN